MADQPLADNGPARPPAASGGRGRTPVFLARNASVVQWIERGPSKPDMGVRFLPEVQAYQGRQVSWLRGFALNHEDLGHYAPLWCITISSGRTD